MDPAEAHVVICNHVAEAKLKYITSNDIQNLLESPNLEEVSILINKLLSQVKKSATFPYRWNTCWLRV